MLTDISVSLSRFLFFNIKHYGQYLPEENKYIVEGGFMSRKEMINGKYAIFVPHYSDYHLTFQKMGGHTYKSIGSDNE